jgi:hypothetical protein
MISVASDELELTVTLVVGVYSVSSLFARAVLLPAFAVIAVFEFWRRRDWLSHALAGGRLALRCGHRLPDGSRFHRCGRRGDRSRLG